MKNETKTPICSKDLYRIGEAKPVLRIKVYSPRASGEDFVCDYTIENLETGKMDERYGYGSDSVQALLLAMSNLGSSIAFKNQAFFDGQLSDFPEEASAIENCGFPMFSEVQQRHIFPKSLA